MTPSLQQEFPSDKKQSKVLSLASQSNTTKMKRILKNQNTVQLIQQLKKLSIDSKAGLWKKLALELEKPSRRKRVVNISKINRYAKENETILVPGKVLSNGDLERSVVVCAYTFSEQAHKKISQKGKALTIQELMKQNPSAKNIKIIG